MIWDKIIPGKVKLLIQQIEEHPGMIKFQRRLWKAKVQLKDEIKKKKKKAIVVFLIYKVLILAAGIGVMYALLTYGNVDIIYLDVFKPAIVFGTMYPLLYTKHTHLKHWMYFSTIIGLGVYFYLYKLITINTMMFFMCGQTLCTSTIVLTGFQIFKLLKYYGITTFSFKGKRPQY